MYQRSVGTTQCIYVGKFLIRTQIGCVSLKYFYDDHKSSGLTFCKTKHMSHYRIIEIRAWNGKKKYYPQYRFNLFYLFPIWCYIYTWGGGIRAKKFTIFEQADSFIDALKRKERIKTYYR